MSFTRQMPRVFPEQMAKPSFGRMRTRAGQERDFSQIDVVAKVTSLLNPSAPHKAHSTVSSVKGNLRQAYNEAIEELNLYGFRALLRR